MVRFGGSAGLSNHEDLLKTVLEIERLGFDSAWIWDHLVNPLGSVLLERARSREKRLDKIGGGVTLKMPCQT